MLLTLIQGMERHETLSQLKQGDLPYDFASMIGATGHQIEEFIKGMLSEDEHQRLGCAEARHILENTI